MDEKGNVGVTGAGGFIASWLVKLLVSEGYVVHGTIRNPDDEKTKNLRKLDYAPEKLLLFKSNLLDEESLYTAFKGCNGVFHVASPVPSSSVSNPEIQLLEPAIKGTLNVLKACKRAQVKRVVFVSSGAAVFMNPTWPKDKVMDEECWSDEQYCKETENWYCLSKTAAEKRALNYAKENGIEFVSVCPSLVLGPLLQPIVNASSLVLLKLLKNEEETVENKIRVIVDVRDVAEALLLTYETPEAADRYICTSYRIGVRDLVEKLKTVYPNFKDPKNFIEVGGNEWDLSSEKLQRLGWKFRPLEETLADTAKYFQEAGFLD